MFCWYLIIYKAKSVIAKMFTMEINNEAKAIAIRCPVMLR